MNADLTNSHIAAEARLRDSLSAAIGWIWNDLPGHDRANVDEWLSKVLPIVSAGQSQSVALTNAYLAMAMDRGPLALDDAKLTGAAVRNGAAPEEVYERPFVTLWSKLGESVAFEEAASAALARAKSTAAVDMQLSMRATAGAVDELDSNIYGYRRVADAGACSFCKAVDGAYVKASAGFAYALHNGCGCSLQPNTEPHDLARHLPDGTDLKPFYFGPLNDVVGVEKHGELGAVLVSPTDHFTSAADLH